MIDKKNRSKYNNTVITKVNAMHDSYCAYGKSMYKNVKHKYKVLHTIRRRNTNE